tara:strand:+ start:804 stop:1043 length:240 start_codon:yes stop_codon:yes gene_type:complete
MDYNYSQSQIINEPPPINLNIKNEENLGTISVFISAILLSCGGFIAMLFSSMKSSRCVNIDCCGISCKRKIIEEDRDEV